MEEKILKRKNNGVAILCLLILTLVAGVALAIFCVASSDGFEKGGAVYILGFVASLIWVVINFILFAGLKSLKPQEAYVFTLFGEYYGTLKGPGFFFVNPFVSANNPAASTKLEQSGDVMSKSFHIKTSDGDSASIDVPSNKLSLKVMTLSNAKQKVNDALGNPVEIAVAVTWRIVDTTKAVFAVENYKEFLSLQCDSAVRDIARIYPYDVAPGIDTTGDGEADDGSLRGSSSLVAARIKKQIQDSVDCAGIEIVDARITDLAYAPEIAAAMLQRQQASAIVDAKQLIVDGAVGMVERALSQLSENQIVELDEERKAAMVSNLLVVLCGNKDAQPIVNSGSLY